MKKKVKLISVITACLLLLCSCYQKQVDVDVTVTSISPYLKSGIYSAYYGDTLYYSGPFGIYVLDAESGEKENIVDTSDIQGISVNSHSIFAYNSVENCIYQYDKLTGEQLAKTEKLYDMQYFFADEFGLYVLANRNSENNPFYEDYSEYLEDYFEFLDFAPNYYYFEDFQLSTPLSDCIYSFESDLKQNPYLSDNQDIYYQEITENNLYRFSYVYDSTNREYYFLDTDTQSKPYTNVKYYLEGPVARKDNKTFIFHYTYSSGEYQDIYGGQEKIGVRFPPLQEMQTQYYVQEIVIKDDDNNIIGAVTLPYEYQFADAFVQDNQLILLGSNLYEGGYSEDSEENYQSSALFAIDLNTYELKKIYESSDQESIIGYYNGIAYSFSEGVIYQIDTAEENTRFPVLNLDTSGHYMTDLYFEICGNYLFVFNGNASMLNYMKIG